MIESPFLNPRIDLFGQKMTFDKLIEILGLNRFNIRIYLFIGLFLMTDGSELIVLSLLINKLTEFWELSSFEKGFLGSAVFVGIALGSFFSGYISDRKGRSPAYIIGSLLVLIFAAGSSLSQGPFSFIILRIICGFGIGITIPALYALATELTPSYNRSIILTHVWIFFPMGAGFVIVLTKYLIEYENGWRYILLFSSFPCLILLILSWNMPESPKFYFSNGQYEKGFDQLEKIIKFANMKDKINLSENDRQDLISEAKEYQLNMQPANYKMLFTPMYKKVTFLICIINFIVSLNYYGASFILPQIFEKELDNKQGNIEDVYYSLFWGCLFEVPSFMISGYLSNYKHLLRIKTIMLGFILNAFITIILLIFPQVITLASALFKSTINISFNIIYVYACEAYPTKIRSMGVGLGGTFTRIAGIFTPLISQIFFEIHEFLPFYIYLIGALFGVFIALRLPYETYNLKLN